MSPKAEMFAPIERIVNKYKSDVNLLAPAASPTALSAAEDHLGRRLPEGLRDFLTRYNGATLAGRYASETRQNSQRQTSPALKSRCSPRVKTTSNGHGRVMPKGIMYLDCGMVRVCVRCTRRLKAGSLERLRSQKLASHGKRTAIHYGLLPTRRTFIKKCWRASDIWPKDKPTKPKPFFAARPIILKGSSVHGKDSGMP